MAGPFDFLFGGGAENTTAPPAAREYRRPDAAGSSIADFWGTPAALRAQREQQDFTDYTRRAGIGQQQQTNQAENTLLMRANELVTQLRETNPAIQPHQMFSTILKDPVFSQNIMRVTPDRMQAIVQSVSQATQRPVEKMDLAPGHMGITVDKDTRQPIGQPIRNPTTEAQTTLFMLDLQPADRQKLLAMQTKQGSDKSAAIDALVMGGLMSPEDGVKAKAGQLHYGVNPTTGQISVTDMTTNPPTVRAAPMQRPTPALPWQQPTEGQPVPPPAGGDERPGARKSLLQNEADMMDVAGTAGDIAATGSRMGQNLPGQGGLGLDWTLKENAYKQMQLSLNTRIINKAQMFAKEAPLVQEAIKGPGFPWDSSTAATARLLQLGINMDRWIEQSSRIINEGEAVHGKATVAHESERRANMIAARADMPSTAALRAKLQALASGEDSPTDRAINDAKGLRNAPRFVPGPNDAELDKRLNAFSDDQLRELYRDPKTQKEIEAYIRRSGRRLNRIQR